MSDFIDEELELKQKAERKIEDINKQIKDLNLPSNLLKLTCQEQKRQIFQKFRLPQKY